MACLSGATPETLAGRSRSHFPSAGISFPFAGYGRSSPVSGARALSRAGIRLQGLPRRVNRARPADSQLHLFGRLLTPVRASWIRFHGLCSISPGAPSLPHISEALGHLAAQQEGNGILPAQATSRPAILDRVPG